MRVCQAHALPVMGSGLSVSAGREQGSGYGQCGPECCCRGDLVRKDHHAKDVRHNRKGLRFRRDDSHDRDGCYR